MEQRKSEQVDTSFPPRQRTDVCRGQLSIVRSAKTRTQRGLNLITVTSQRGWRRLRVYTSSPQQASALKKLDKRGQPTNPQPFTHHLPLSFLSFCSMARWSRLQQKTMMAGVRPQQAQSRGAFGTSSGAQSDRTTNV